MEKTDRRTDASTIAKTRIAFMLSRVKMLLVSSLRKFNVEIKSSSTEIY